MKLAVYQDVGTKAIPQEVRRLRRETWDFQRRLGVPVVFKHAWTEEDVAAGVAEHCPYCRDEAYQQGTDWDPYCFGTGYLGGFDDGVITFITIGDALEDVFKVNQQGLLMRDSHPICTAAWLPKMADGDLIINATFEEDTWEIVSTAERFLLNSVTPVAPRGAAGSLTAPPRGISTRIRKQHNKHLVAQNFQINKLPFAHRFFQVPVEFTVSLPDEPFPPPGVDPSGFEDVIDRYTGYAVWFVIHGGGEDVFVTFPLEEEMFNYHEFETNIRMVGA